MARTNNLSNFLTDVADAIRTKKRSEEPIAAADFDTEIENLPSGGNWTTPATENDVMFYDYDGGVIYSYTKDEFLELEEMPPVPTHNGLTAQGWNWTLEELQDYVEDYGVGQAGATYTPTDKKTKFIIELNETELSLRMGLVVNGSAIVNWGDGTEEETITGTSTSTTVYTPHVYNQPGNYVISLDVQDGTEVRLKGTESVGQLTQGYTKTGSYLFDSGSETNENGTNGIKRSTNYFTILKGIILNENTKIDSGGLYAHFALEYIIFSQSNAIVNRAPNYFINGCPSLKIVILPRGYTTAPGVGDSYNPSNIIAYVLPPTITTVKDIGRYSTNLKKCLIPKSVTYIFQYCCDSAKALEIGVIPKNTNPLTYWADSTFQSCSSLRKVIIATEDSRALPSSFCGGSALTYIDIPPNITSVSGAFYSCLLLRECRFLKNISVPSANTNSFPSTTEYLKIKVPEALYEQWVTTTGWTTFAPRIYPCDANGNEMTKATITLATDSSTDAVINVSTSVLTVVSHSYTLPSYSDLTTTSLEENLQFSDGTNTYSLGDTITVAGDTTFTLVDTGA